MKRARRCSVSWARRARKLRFSSGVTLVSHQLVRGESYIIILYINKKSIVVSPFFYVQNSTAVLHITCAVDKKSGPRTQEQARITGTVQGELNHGHLKDAHNGAKNTHVLCRHRSKLPLSRASSGHLDLLYYDRYPGPQFQLSSTALDSRDSLRFPGIS